MSDKTVKVLGRHRKGCRAVLNEKNGTWDTCWGPLAFGAWGKPVVKTERRYGKKGRAFKTWLRFICNDPQCKAELHVDASFVLSIAAASVKT